MKDKKMQVLYLEQTGHIVAAFTRNAAEESPLDVKSMTGRDLLVRNATPGADGASIGGETLSVPVDFLKAQIVEWNDRVFAMPYNFMVGGGEAIDLRNGTAPIVSGLTATSISIQITDGHPVSEDTAVWVQVQQQDPESCFDPVRMIMSDLIKRVGTDLGGGYLSDGISLTLDLRPRPDQPPASIPEPTQGMEYSVLVLVAGRPPGFSTQDKSRQS